MSVDTSQVFKSTLYLFSPKKIPDQVLRPYVYNFTDNIVTAMTESSDAYRTAIVDAREAYDSGDTSSLAGKDAWAAIVPDSNGFKISMDEYNKLWRFVLVLRNKDDRALFRFFPRTTTVACGFVDRIPFNTETRQPNNDAVLSATKVITFIKSTTGDVRVCDRDIIRKDDPGLESVSCLADPSHLFKDDDNSTIVVNNALRIAQWQLTDIAAYIENVIWSVKDQYEFGSRDFTTSPKEMAVSEVYENLSHMKNAPEMDMELFIKPISISDLLKAHSDTIITPVQSCNPTIGTDQQVLSNENTLSSMLASTLPALTASSNLSSISFAYNSKTDEFMVNGFSNGIIPGDNGTTPTEWFEETFRRCVAPVVRRMGGEFNVLCWCDIIGETMVQLKLASTTKEELYVTSALLGGILNPMRADDKIRKHNAEQLDHFAKSIIDKVFL